MIPRTIIMCPECGITCLTIDSDNCEKLTYEEELQLMDAHPRFKGMREAMISFIEHSKKGPEIE